MAAYKFLDKVDTNRVFVVNRSELEGRLDPSSVLPEKLNFYNVLKSKRTIIRLKNIIKEGAYGILPPGDSYDDRNPIKFIRATELKPDLKIDFINVNYVNSKYYTDRARIKKNDILLAVKGATIAGEKCVSIVLEEPDKSIVNGSIFRFQVNEEKTLPIYIAYILNSDLLKKQMKYSLVANNAVDYLDKSLIYNLLIPLPPIEAQQQIVNRYTQAYHSKQQKEQEAERLLAGIDAYLLNELGITLPEQKNSLQSRIFTVNFSEVTGGRVDPFTIFTNDFKIEGGIYPNKKLWKIAEITKGQSITSKHVIEGEYPVIAGGKTSPYTHNKYNFQGNVITVSASGAYSGYAWYHTKPIFASDCSVIWSKNENELLTLYLAEVLKAKQKEIYNLQQGAGQPHVYPNDLAKLNIPTPEMAKQKEIADTISKLRAKAKQLKKEAKRLLEDAKKEVEQLILGE